jgi:hypothetical protein
MSECTTTTQRGTQIFAPNTRKTIRLSKTAGRQRKFYDVEDMYVERTMPPP